MGDIKSNHQLTQINIEVELYAQLQHLKIDRNKNELPGKKTTLEELINNAIKNYLKTQRTI